METKQFVLVIAQALRFAVDLEGLIAQLHEELESCPELKENLEIIWADSANYAILSAQIAFCRQTNPARILVVTEAVYEGDHRGGERVGREMQKISVPVWMYSNSCTWYPGIERCFSKYGGSNPSERVAEGRLAKDILSHFRALR